MLEQAELLAEKILGFSGLSQGTDLTRQARG
jgi:hypothetical protein